MTVKIDGTNTVANPAFTGADTDTGLQCGTNEVKLVTGGTARATVDSSGNLGVGTTSPESNRRLTVDIGTSSVNVAVFKSQDTSGGSYIGFMDKDTTNGNRVRVGAINDDMAFITAGSERLRLNAAGQLTTPNQPSFQAVRSGNYSQNGSDDFAPYNSTIHNRGNHYNTSTYRFTAPVAGHYLFFANVYRQSGAFGSHQIRKNNTNHYSFTEYTAYNNNDHAYGIAIVDMGVNDYVHIRAGAYKIDGNSFFGGYLLG